MTRMRDLAGIIKSVYVGLKENGHAPPEEDVQSLAEEWINTIEEIDILGRDALITTFQEFLQSDSWQGTPHPEGEFTREEGPNYTVFRGNGTHDVDLFAARTKDTLGAFYNTLFKDFSDVIGGRIVSNSNRVPGIPFRAIARIAESDESDAITTLEECVLDDDVILTLLERRKVPVDDWAEESDIVRKELEGMITRDYVESFNNIIELYRREIEPVNASFVEHLPSWFTHFVTRQEDWTMLDRVPVTFSYENWQYSARTYQVLGGGDETPLTLTVIKGPAEHTSNVDNYWGKIWRSNNELRKKSSPLHRNHLIKRKWDHMLSDINLPNGSKVIEREDMASQVWYRADNYIFCVQGDVEKERFWSELRVIVNRFEQLREAGKEISGKEIEREVAGALIDGNSEEIIGILPNAEIIDEPVKRTFKNKPYHARHCSYSLPGGIPVEIQFRTQLEHYDAEWGGAAHEDHKEFLLNDLEDMIDNLPERDGRAMTNFFKSFERAVMNEYAERAKEEADRLVESLHSLRELQEKDAAAEEIMERTHSIKRMSGCARKAYKNSFYGDEAWMQPIDATVAGIPRSFEEVLGQALLEKDVRMAARSSYEVLAPFLPEDMAPVDEWIATAQARSIKDVVINAWREMPDNSKGMPRWRRVFPLVVRDTLYNLGEYLNVTGDRNVLETYRAAIEEVRGELPPELRDGYGAYNGNTGSVHDFNEKLQGAIRRGELDQLCARHRVIPIYGSIKQQFPQTFQRIHEADVKN